MLFINNNIILLLLKLPNFLIIDLYLFINDYLPATYKLEIVNISNVLLYS